MGWETVELNASDQRTADVIERFAGRAARNATLGGSAAGGGGAAGGDTASRQLVILDEADNIHGNYDRGARAQSRSWSRSRVSPSSSSPTTTTTWRAGSGTPHRRSSSAMSPRAPSSPSSATSVARRIEFESDALERIAERNRGDLRGAINDLQAATEGRDSIAVEDVVTGDRDRRSGCSRTSMRSSKRNRRRRRFSRRTPSTTTPDDLTKWIENNVLDVYDPSEVVRAYDFLANADVWLGRVRATQNYSYWRYATDNAAAGVAAARDGTKGGWTRYGRPQFWSPSDATADEVVGQIAAKSGCSVASQPRVARCSRFWRRSPTTASPAS